MSTILDALRRLESDRRRRDATERSHATGLGDEPGFGSGPRRTPAWLLGGGVGVAVVAVAAAAFFGLRPAAHDATSVAGSAPLAAAIPSVAGEPADRSAELRIASPSPRLRPGTAPDAERTTIPSAAAPVAPPPPRARAQVSAPAPGARNEPGPTVVRPVATTTPAAVSAQESAAVSAPVSAAASAPVSAAASAPVSAAVSAPVSAAASAPVSASVTEARRPESPSGESAPRAESSEQRLAARSLADSLSDPGFGRGTASFPEPTTIAEPRSRQADALAADRSDETALPVARAAEVSIVRTVWHPSPERRIAHVQIAGESSDREVHEGDVVEGYEIEEIKLTGVVFVREGVTVERRVSPKQR